MFDDLESLWNDLEPSLRKRFLIFTPWDMTWDEPIVTWDPEEGIDEFLNLAQSLGVPMLYVSVTRFNEEALSELQSRLLDPEGPHPQTGAILTRAEEYMERISSIEIGWMFQGVGHFCEIVAAWSQDLETVIANEQEFDAMELAAERLMLDEQLSFVPEWARQVAEKPEFQQARTMYQRTDMIPQLLPELGEIISHYRHGTWILRRLSRDIAREAFRIYEYEILPGKEVEQASQAHELLGRGLRKYEVAARLGISKERLNRLIAKYPPQPEQPSAPSVGDV
ncbi:MAG TPA: hypothetical protein VE174_09260 [Actinomycetota bacterium]|nr:hypothetical protein [Actinomycetota bacterium]